ncbi:MAG: TonB-dependent receptor [Myxococcota bacterium]|nr:TonB-dependent receptor [Myxococcota bacterium]
MKAMGRWVLGGVWLAGAAFGQALDESPPPDELALFELDTQLALETQVASQRAQSIRETPGVVTVIQREEIVAAGARDLIDVLRLVPGFDFAVDVQGVVGVGFRGNWGHEGKVLLVWDGQELNEHLYSTLQLGNHYPVDHIQRVEIIRGPGSARYGGYAELAVIKVTTRGAKELNGGAVSVTYGQQSADFGRRSLSLGYGQQLSQLPGLSFTVQGLVGQGHRGEGVYQDSEGSEFPLRGNARTDPLFLNLGVEYRSLQLRVLYDDYRQPTRDGFDVLFARTEELSFSTLVADARVELLPGQRASLVPRVNFKRALPWRSPAEDSETFYDKATERLTAGLTLSVDVADWLNVTAGGELYLDRAWLNNPLREGYNTPFGDSDEVAYQNRAAFAEVLVEHPWVNVVVGARMEEHSAVGLSFVPRVAVTRLVDRFHFKALFSRAFRAPGIENLNLSPGIRPETTNVFELEAGYRLTDSLFASANAFDIGISDPIVYFYDEATDSEGYGNFGRTGTRGVEAELRFKQKGMWANASYSLYAVNENQVEAYRVPDRPSVLLGFPTHKLTLNAGYQVWGGLQLNPSVIVHSERFGYAPGAGGWALQSFPPSLLLNLFASWRDLGVRGLDVSVGVHDLLNHGTRFVQPYDGGHAPLPGPGRELVGRVSYAYRFE